MLNINKNPSKYSFCSLIYIDCNINYLNYIYAWVDDKHLNEILISKYCLKELSCLPP